MSTLLRGRLVTPDQVIDDGALVFDGDRIAWVGSEGEAAEAGFAAELDAAGEPWPYLLPGLVDLHNHGGGGASFPDATDRASAMTAVAEHRRHGTTSLVASLVSATPETLRARVRLLAELADSEEIAGIHLEGPFLSAARCGAHDPEALSLPDPALTAELAELAGGHLVTMTLAPELPGALACADALISAGALPSWGHTDAGPADTAAALASTLGRLRPHRRATATHLFNAMRPWHHRDPGPIGELLAAAVRGEVVVELIGDGVHVAPEVVREVCELVGSRAAVLVTDAMAAAGMADGSYRLGSLDVTVTDGVARLSTDDGQPGSIAGGTAHLIDIVRATTEGGVALVDAVRMASTTPAEVLGDPQIGALEPGRRADLLLADEQLRPVKVFRRGREVT
ncbi:N-acetylglucosamine-6-phosphate deacetylase [Bogoriella caseilytica]|uniref:N-acetylglucosamine-6-phosphate deacetylase n=1 Tax=Bogoriella caseilytica TaxID=56055 RepID=A0A3N2BA96_9MICO|nr:amidohydrolase family protein [Bogoriella caseilytica]ROR72082.1 N-acetylglucosamine-6-phosphate deacetylase [Bogoriella caseilytica]